MRIDQAVDVLRKMRFKTRRPAEKNQLPQFMENWSDLKIDDYYKNQKEKEEALTIAINCLNGIDKFKQASYDLVDIFENFIPNEDKKDD